MLSIPNIRQTDPGSPEEFYIINENLDEYLDNILRHLNISPKRVSRLGGSACINLKIETAEGDLVLKISPYDGILQVAEYFYRRISEINIPSPRVSTIDRSKKVIPFEYMIMDFIEGSMGNELPSLQSYEAGRKVGSTIRQIHSILIDQFDEYIASYTIWDYEKWVKHLSYYINSVPVELKKKLFKDEEVKIVENLLNHPGLKIGQPYLLHGDLHRENCIFELNGETLDLKALIDPNTAFGDPMFDLAAAEVLEFENPDFYRGIMDSYGEISLQEETRIKILRVIFIYWLTCWRAAQGLETETHLLKFKYFFSLI